jgi:hypothetical protein
VIKLEFSFRRVYKKLGEKKLGKYFNNSVKSILASGIIAASIRW